MFSKEREVKSDNVSMGKIETDYYWITLELEENRITLSFPKWDWTKTFHEVDEQGQSNNFQCSKIIHCHLRCAFFHYWCICLKIWIYAKYANGQNEPMFSLNQEMLFVFYGKYKKKYMFLQKIICIKQRISNLRKKIKLGLLFQTADPSTHPPSTLCIWKNPTMKSWKP